MRIVLLSAASSIHTIRWANGLNAVGHEVHVVSQHEPNEILDKGITLHQFPFKGLLGYFLMVPKVRDLFGNIQPDIVNAHYASGYGTTARLVGYHPWVLSVWGSDIYNFPYKSLLHKWLVRTNLYAADSVTSTSACMADETRKLAPKLSDIVITPFGVDMRAYQNVPPVNLSESEELVIGTVKTMSYIYGIDTLINAFALLLKKLEKEHKLVANKLCLRLVGGGIGIEEYKNYAASLGIANKVQFVGQVAHREVINELMALDVYVALSRQESFGVAILEAGAARRPVVVSDAEGLSEVVQDRVTGIVVPREDPQAAADVLEELILDPHLRRKLGESGRKHVELNYSWDVSVKNMECAYQLLLKQ